MVERLVAWLLAVAARRWPPAARDDLVREWTAEAYALGHEPGVAAAVRTWRRVRFAASLACVRPQQAGAGRGDAAERAVQHGFALLFAPLVAIGLAFVTTGPLWMYVTAQLAPDSVALTVVYRVAQVAWGVVCGLVLARKLPRARWDEPVSVGRLVSAGAVIVAGLVVADGTARIVASAYPGVDLGLVAAVGVGALLLPLTAGVAALARRRPALAIAVAAAGAPVVVAGATLLVVRSQPAPAWAAGDPWWWLAEAGRLTGPSYLDTSPQVSPTPIETVLPVLPGVILTTVALMLAYTLRLARPIPLLAPARSRSYAAPLTAIVAIGLIGYAWGHVPFDAWPAVSAPALFGTTVATLALGLALAWRFVAARRSPTVPAETAAAVSPWWHRIALVGAVYSALAWAVTLAYLTPNIGVQASWPRVGDPPPAGWPGWNSEEGRIWMQDLQLYAIGCAALCLAFAVAFRGGSVLPVLGGALVLLAADAAVVGWHLTRAELLPGFAAGAVLLGAVVWWASVRFGRHAAPRRRLLVRLTVMAAFLVPGIYIHRYVPSRLLPPSVVLVAVGLPTVLAVLAALGVASMTTPRPRRLPLAVGVGAAIVGWLSFMDFTRLDVPFLWPLTYLSFILAPVLAVPAAAVATVALRPSSGRRGPIQWIAPVALTLPLGWVTAYITIFISLIGGQLLPGLEYGRAYDGLPYVAGAVPVALLVAHVAASIVTRGVPALSPVDHELSPSR